MEQSDLAASRPAAALYRKRPSDRGGATSRLTRVAEYRFRSANGRIVSAETGLLLGIETNGAALLDRRLQLDIENRGNAVAAWLNGPCAALPS